MGKIDVVIQGALTKYTNEVIDQYLEIPAVNKIIVSCWENDAESLLKNRDRITLNKNKDIENPGMGNRNRQILSSLSGINMVESDFCIKARSDQKITSADLEKIIDYYFKNLEIDSSNFEDAHPNKKIGILSFYPDLPMHPRDHFFIGHKTDMKTLFDIEFDSKTSLGLPGIYRSYMRSEAYIGKWYFAKYDKRISEMLSDENFYILDDSPGIEEGRKKSMEVMEKIFLLLPKIDIEWEKYGFTKEKPLPYYENELYLKQ
jgi:hypothetical protein